VEYICYIELADSAVPVMDIVEAGAIDTVYEHARRMMGEHAGSTTATIYLGDALVGSLRKEPAPPPKGGAAPSPSPGLRPAAGIRPRR
jgi:hypothetical protein